MFRVMLAIVIGMLGTTGLAQQASTGATDAKKKYVAFRMENWKARHIHDEEQAKTYIKTLKTLGCEVKTGRHDGHTDVQCRTGLWKSLALDSQDQVHQWVSWLQQSGFETIHGHQAGTHKSPDSEGKRLEIVKFRLADWRSQHIHNATELNQVLTLYRALGCEVETREHSGHTDVQARCTQWMEIELPSHEIAHNWQNFLKNAGFETQHEH